jgi:hypothetical protein
MIWLLFAVLTLLALLIWFAITGLKDSPRPTNLDEWEETFYD